MAADRVVLLLAAPLSWVIMLLTYRYATARGVLDVPTERSSHSARSMNYPNRSAR